MGVWKRKRAKQLNPLHSTVRNQSFSRGRKSTLLNRASVSPKQSLSLKGASEGRLLKQVSNMISATNAFQGLGASPKRQSKIGLYQGEARSPVNILEAAKMAAANFKLGRNSSLHSPENGTEDAALLENAAKSPLGTIAHRFCAISQITHDQKAMNNTVVTMCNANVSPNFSRKTLPASLNKIPSNSKTNPRSSKSNMPAPLTSVVDGTIKIRSSVFKAVDKFQAKNHGKRRSTVKGDTQRKSRHVHPHQVSERSERALRKKSFQTPWRNFTIHN